jgi:hypothetical protein
MKQIFFSWALNGKAARLKEERMKEGKKEGRKEIKPLRRRIGRKKEGMKARKKEERK